MNVAPEPFPYAVLDGWFDANLLEAVADEVPDPADPRWKRYDNPQERKLEGPPNLWGERTWELLAQIEKLTGDIEEAFATGPLHMSTVGGGYHAIPPGGYLDVHTDFNRHGDLYRRINLLVYLNQGWNDPGGRLELWDDKGPVKSVAPLFNRTVIFATSDRSWHGHPIPAQRWRRSFAAYFFSDSPPPGYRADQSTVFHDH